MTQFQNIRGKNHFIKKLFGVENVITLKLNNIHMHSNAVGVENFCLLIVNQTTTKLLVCRIFDLLASYAHFVAHLNKKQLL
jgi:hypothetical protein